MVSYVTPPKIETSVPGLDTILHGGLRAERVTPSRERRVQAGRR